MSARRLPAIVAALPEEARALMRRVDVSGPRRQPDPIPGVEEVRVGELGGAAVTVAVTGDGERCARAGISALLREVRPSRLLVVGVGGALTPDLRAGSLVVGAEVWGVDGERFIPAAADLVLASSALGVPAAVLLTRPSLAVTPAAKEALLREVRRVSAANGPAVVDQESAVYAAAAEAAGIPWLVVRAISDAAEEALPPYLARCLGPEGSIRRVAVAWHTALRLWHVPGVLRLARRVRAASVVLAEAGECWLTADARRRRSNRALDEPVPASESPRFSGHRSMPRERGRREIRSWR